MKSLIRIAAASTLLAPLFLAGCKAAPSAESLAQRKREERSLQSAILYHRMSFLYREGERLRTIGRLNAAMQKYESALDRAENLKRTNPGWGRNEVRRLEQRCRLAMESVGAALRQKDVRVSSALARFSRALAAQPDSAEPYVALADFYFDEADYNEAMKLYRDALMKNPSHVGAQINIARIYSRIGDYYEAKKIYASLLQVQPQLEVVHYNLGGIYFRENKPTYALREYRRVIELRPDYAEAYNAAGLVYKQLRQYDNALAQFRNAIRLDPRYASAYYNMGITFIAKNNHPTGLKYLQHAIELFGQESPRGRAIAEGIRRMHRYH